MTNLETDRLYYNTRLYFRQHILDTLPNNESIWYSSYRQWLKEQGCVICRPKKGDIEYIVDGLGVAPGYDYFSFEREEDAALFVLKWS